jgi:hypothetical protein
MFYSTRHFFRLAFLLLAGCVVYERLPDMLLWIKSVWAPAERFMSAFSPHAAASLLIDALNTVMQTAK